MCRIALVRNPHSGTAPDIAELARALREADVAADIFDIPSGSTFGAWIDGVASRYAIVAAAGGDGTVSSVAAAVARANKTLAVVPTGTLNHFARDAGIPTDFAEAIAILRTGVARPVDIGSVNGRVFLNDVSLGNYPRMVKKRESLEERGHSRRLAGIVAVARTWWDLRSVTAHIVIDGRELVRRSPFILIGNGQYVLSGFALGRRGNISDERLWLYVAPRAGRLGALSLPIRALVGTLERYEQFEIFSARQIEITLSAGRVPAGIDGEIQELQPPLRLSIRAGGLRLLVPQP
jgi:diacylglycerol kinase family enzyme